MFHVPEESLWLGNVGDVRKMRMILDHGIEALIDLALNEPVPELPREIIYCRFPLVDGPGNEKSLIETAIATTVRLLRSKKSTLVFCSGGVSRSPAIGAAVLSVLSGQSPDVSLKELSQKVPHDVSPGLWQEIREVAETIDIS